MKLENVTGKTVRIKGIPSNTPCFSCTPCMRLRLMELGLIEGQKIELTKHSLGLWIVKVLSENGTPSFTLALRDEEMSRILVEDESCVFNLVD